MPGINKVFIGGHLTRDPELRVTPNGTAICNFCVANSRKYKTEQGEQREDVAFVDVDAWGKTGEIIAKHFSKGSPILVWGRLKQDSWEDKQTGAKRTKLKVTVTFPEGGFDFCGNTQGAGQGDGSAEDGGTDQAPPPPQQRQAPPQQQRQSPPPQRQAPRPAPVENLDEDVPF